MAQLEAEMEWRGTWHAQAGVAHVLIAQLRRHLQSAALADAHARYALLPALYDIPFAQLELEGVPFQRALKLSAINQPALQEELCVLIWGIVAATSLNG